MCPLEALVEGLIESYNAKQWMPSLARWILWRLLVKLWQSDVYSIAFIRTSTFYLPTKETDPHSLQWVLPRGHLAIFPICETMVPGSITGGANAKNAGLALGYLFIIYHPILTA